MPRRSTRRPFALLLALMLVVAACSDDAPSAGEDAAPTPEVEAPSSDDAPGDDDGPTPTVTAPAGAGGDSGSTPGTASGSGWSEGQTTTSTTARRPSVDLRGPVGSMGRTLLRSDVSGVVLEVDSSPNRGLRSSSIDALRSELSRSGGKTVELAGGDVLPSRDVWSDDQLRAVAAQHRASGAGPDHVSIQVLVVSGRHERDGVAGVAFDASSFAVFPDVAQGGLLGLSAATVERALVIHELGHLFGLVDLTGHGSFHEDPDHPGHSANRGSVMFWAVERDVVSQVFEGGPPTEFDADDREEMSRIRG